MNSELNDARLLISVLSFEQLIIGEAIFGLGWGMAGLCPGPAMFLACAGYPNVLLRWWPSFFVGAFVAEKVKGLMSAPKVSPSKK